MRGLVRIQPRTFLHLGIDLIEISLVCYLNGWLRVGGWSWSGIKGFYMFKNKLKSYCTFSKNPSCSNMCGTHIYIGVLMFFLFFLFFLFLFLFHWKLETTDFGHFCCFQILDDVITAECITSRGYAARFHLGCDIIVISPVCYRDGWVRVGGGGQEKKDHD